jgi:hypothetical protein
MIATVNLALFPSDELFTLAKGIISLSVEKKTQLPVIIPFLDNVIQKCNNFQSALERESKNPFIKLQSEKNDALSDSFLSFRKQCESGQTRRKEGWKPAAEILLAVIRKHGWSAHNMGYKAKTAAIITITSEIRAKHMTELAKIQATEWLEELEAAKADFATAAMQVVEAASANHEYVVADTRPELIAALKALFQTISLQQIAAPSVDLDALTDQLNELIGTSLATVKASNTRAENSKNAAAKKNINL